MDIRNKGSIERLLETLGSFDALVSTVRQVKCGPLAELSDADWDFCLSDKLMGQVNLVGAGLRHVAEGGSFTLTSGLLARYPVPGGSAMTLVNAGLEAFAKAASMEMPRNARINVVSPPWVSETLEAMGRDASKGLPAAKVAKAYVESVEGTRNGETLDARELAQTGISLSRAVSKVAHPAIHASETGVSTLETAVSGSETGVAA